MKTISLLFSLAMLASACGQKDESTSAVQSNYPSNYPIASDERSVEDKVSIQRHYQSDNGIGLSINYKGYLRSTSGLKMFVRINYLDGSRELLVPMDWDTGAEARFTLSSACLVGMLGGCAEHAPDEMKHLLYWAATSGRLNALDIEVAFTNDNGDWDSKNAQNYRLQFGELRAW